MRGRGVQILPLWALPLTCEPNLRTILDPSGLLRDQSLATTTKTHRQLDVFPNSHTLHNPRTGIRHRHLRRKRRLPGHITHHYGEGAAAQDTRHKAQDLEGGGDPRDGIRIRYTYDYDMDLDLDDFVIGDRGRSAATRCPVFCRGQHIRWRWRGQWEAGRCVPA
jgi:hypothetical protein